MQCQNIKTNMHSPECVWIKILILKNSTLSIQAEIAPTHSYQKKAVLIRKETNDLHKSQGKSLQSQTVNSIELCTSISYQDFQADGNWFGFIQNIFRCTKGHTKGINLSFL